MKSSAFHCAGLYPFKTVYTKLQDKRSDMAKQVGDLKLKIDGII